MKYTQRDWDRTVGWGKVPEEYSLEEKRKNENDKTTLLEDAKGIQQRETKQSRKT